ncbi:MAG: DegV family protein [Erysipelotrichaceae bacterium]|nr:DegV family protein [Erysipelotrichaceae bacterium]
MAKLSIFIDSTGDLDAELRKKYSIDYCAMSISFHDPADNKDHEIRASLDWDQGYSPKQFYDVMRTGTKIYTAQVTRQEFLDRFVPALEAGNDVLYIACSSSLSRSIDLANQVAVELRERYPERKIVCVDSLISGYAQGDMAIRARKMSEEGKTIEEIASWLEENKLKFNQWATTENLSYLKRAGRVKASSAFFGNILAIKPILISDAAGNNYAIKKVKGRKASLMEIIKDTIDSAEDIEHQTIYVAHADDLEGAEFCVEQLKKLAHPQAIHIGNIGPIIGGSTGPGTLAIYSFGKKVEVIGQ